jgi:O-methyltransferase
MLRKTVERFRIAKEESRLRKTFRKYREFTMVPEDIYTANLRLASRVKSIPGAIVECGTWRGGMIAGLADVLGSKRRYFLFDSYEGLPPAKQVDGEVALAWQKNTKSAAYYDNCRASEDEARSAMSMSAASDYTIVKGWFENTLPKTDVGPVALLRMDADWYDSTKQILDNLAGRVVPGGVIIVDDYYAYEGCTLAVNEHAAKQKWMIRQYSPGGVCYIVVSKGNEGPI